MVARYITAKRD